MELFLATPMEQVTTTKWETTVTRNIVRNTMELFLVTPTEQVTTMKWEITVTISEIVTPETWS